MKRLLIALLLISCGYLFHGEQVPTAYAQLSGAPISTAPVTKTADFTLGAAETSIINNKPAAGIVMTLPTGPFPGRILWVQNNQAQTFTAASAVVVPKGGGAAGTAILPANATAWAMLVYGNGVWVIMMSGT